MPPRKSKTSSSETAVAEVPAVDEKKITALIEKIREGMPSVEAMKSQGFGVLRKHQEWEQKSRPFIAELSALLGHPVSAERYRPGREDDPLKY